MAVGIFDSGLGGLTVLEAVTKKIPKESFVYMGDNLHAPYGIPVSYTHLTLQTKREV